MLNREHQQIVCSAKFMDVALLTSLPHKFTFRDVFELIGDRARARGRLYGMQTRGLIIGAGDIHNYQMTERGKEVANAGMSIWSELA